jgi:hypothetical protein
LDVLQLVLLCDGEVGAVGDQLLRLDLPEVIAVVGEGQLQEIFDGGVVEHPGQRFEVFVVLLLHVPVGDGDRQDVLVERGGKVCVEEVAVIEGLSCDPADELEVVEVSLVEVGGGGGVVGVACGAGAEESVVWVEHFP